MVASYAAQVSPHKPNGTTITRSILSFYPGANNYFHGGSDYLSASAFLTAWNSYMDTAIADGFEVIAWTLPKNSYPGMYPSDEANRQAINEGIRLSTKPTWLIEADQIMGDMSASTRLSSDNLHPNAVGHYMLAREIDAVLQGKRDSIFKSVVGNSQLFATQTIENLWLSGRLFQFSNDESLWAKTVVGTGAASALAGQNAMLLNTGTTTGSSVLMRLDGSGGAGWPGNQGGGSRSLIDWRNRFRVALKFYIIAPSANTICRIGFGDTYNLTTVRDIGNLGVGIKIENTAIKVMMHNGTTPTVSASLATTAANTIEHWILDSDGTGLVEVYRNGVYLTTLTGGPEILGSASRDNIHISVSNGAGTTDSYLCILDIRGIAD